VATHGTLGAAKLAVVIGKLVDVGVDVTPAAKPLAAAGASRVRCGRSPGAQASLGDRRCLALTLRRPPTELLTADWAWADLDLPLRVRLIR
jgi:ribonuclease VapC